MVEAKPGAKISLVGTLANMGRSKWPATTTFQLSRIVCMSNGSEYYQTGEKIKVGILGSQCTFGVRVDNLQAPD